MQILTTTDGLPLHTRQWRKPARGIDVTADKANIGRRGTVLIVHGLGEHIGRYAAVAERLNAEGWQVWGYDQRGHGESGGARGDVPDGEALQRDLAQAIDAVRANAEWTAGPLLLLGHSMGGLVAARFVAGGLMAKQPAWFRPVDGLILSSPAFDPGLSAWQRLQLKIGLALTPHLAVGNGLKPDWICRDPAVVRAYLADPLVHKRITPTLAQTFVDGGELMRLHAPAWAVPTLLMWAGSDRCVAPAGSAAFAATAPTAVVSAQCFEPLFHELFNEPEREQVLLRLAAWLAERFTRR